MLLNVEFKKVYLKYLKKIKKNYMWNIMITLNCRGQRDKPRLCIPIEIGHIIYKFL